MGQQTYPKQKKTKTRIFKVFLDVHREIEWLNAMSKKGYHLVARVLFFYEFVVDSSRCYQYQVDLRPMRGRESEHRAFSEFLSEMGIEIACKYLNYVYLQKEGVEPFEYYTDPADWRKQFSRHAMIYGMMMFLSVVNMISLSNLGWPGPYLIKIAVGMELSVPVIATSVIAVMSGLGLKHYLGLLRKWTIHT